MQEPRMRRFERERSLIVQLRDKDKYSFKEIAEMSMFNVSAQAIHKRYKKAKGLTKG